MSAPPVRRKGQRSPALPTTTVAEQLHPAVLRPSSPSAAPGNWRYVYVIKALALNANAPLPGDGTTPILVNSNDGGLK